MTEKRYWIEEIGDMFRVLKDKEPLTTKFENTDKRDVINLVDELNELVEENMMLKGENAHYKLLLMSLEETAKRFFPNGLNNVIFIDTGKPNRKQILEQLWNGEPLISDEEAFERHLLRKWSKK